MAIIGFKPLDGADDAVGLTWIIAVEAPLALDDVAPTPACKCLLTSGRLAASALAAGASGSIEGIEWHMSKRWSR